MAGEWIKMNKTLPRDSRVVRIASALNADRLRVVGGLLSAWCLFDEQTEDGIIPGYTPEIFDEFMNFPGLARAMESVGWLEIGAEFIAAPRYDEHNGQSAKRRAQESNRKRTARNEEKCPHPKRTESGLEKRERREELFPPLSPKGEEITKKENHLPKGWKDLTKDQRKRLRVDANSPSMAEIGKFFGRASETLWTVAEGVALFELRPTPEDVAILARYYRLPLEKESDFRRRDLATLLNNWQTEVDRARTHFAATDAA